MLTCPNCRYECPSHSFIRLADSKLKCRRCRGEFDDPDAYRPNVSYADTDSDKMVSRFPYSLSGQNAVIRVPDGYLAYVIGASEGGMLLTSGNCEIKDEPTWIQVYYICLNPRLPWGSRGLKKFGAYGTAQLSISEDFVKNSMVFIIS